MAASDKINFGNGIKPQKGQLNFDNEFLNVLNNYQADAHDYLYDLEPQSQNLFWAGYFRESLGSGGNGEVKPFYNASFRIRSVNIPMPKMEIDNHPELRVPIFKNANFSQEVTIEWFEDVYHSVSKYHLDWFARWYNRQFDVLRCGVIGKFRQMTVVAYHYINSDVDSLIEVPKIQPIFAIKIGGMMPLSIPDMKFDHSADMNDQPLSFSYRVGTIQWCYSDEIGKGTGSDPLFADTPPASLTDVASWNPEGFAQEGGDPNDKLLEQIRIARAATSYQAVEGSLG